MGNIVQYTHASNETQQKTDGPFIAYSGTEINQNFIDWMLKKGGVWNETKLIHKGTFVPENLVDEVKKGFLSHISQDQNEKNQIELIKNHLKAAQARIKQKEKQIFDLLGFNNIESFQDWWEKGINDNNDNFLMVAEDLRKNFSGREMESIIKKQMSDSLLYEIVRSRQEVQTIIINLDKKGKKNEEYTLKKITGNLENEIINSLQKEVSRQFIYKSSQEITDILFESFKNYAKEGKIKKNSVFIIKLKDKTIYIRGLSELDDKLTVSIGSMFPEVNQEFSNEHKAFENIFSSQNSQKRNLEENIFQLLKLYYNKRSDYRGKIKRKDKQKLYKFFEKVGKEFSLMYPKDTLIDKFIKEELTFQGFFGELDTVYKLKLREEEKIKEKIKEKLTIRILNTGSAFSEGTPIRPSVQLAQDSIVYIKKGNKNPIIFGIQAKNPFDLTGNSYTTYKETYYLKNLKDKDIYTTGKIFSQWFNISENSELLKYFFHLTLNVQNDENAKEIIKDVEQAMYAYALDFLRVNPAKIRDKEIEILEKNEKGNPLIEVLRDEKFVQQGGYETIFYTVGNKLISVAQLLNEMIVVLEKSEIPKIGLQISYNPHKYLNETKEIINDENIVNSCLNKSYIRTAVTIPYPKIFKE